MGKTYDDIIRDVMENDTCGDNVRVVWTATDRNGERKTALTHYILGFVAHRTYGMRRFLSGWRVFDIEHLADEKTWKRDWDAKRNWHPDTYATEEDALAYMVGLSDYAMAH